MPIATRAVVARLLAKSPDRRPANAGEFASELAKIEKIQRESEMTRRALAEPLSEAVTVPAGPGPGGAPPPRDPGAPAPSAPPPRRRSGVPVIVVLLAVLAAVALWLARAEARGAGSSAVAPARAVRPTAAPAPIAEASPEPRPTAEPPLPTAPPAAVPAPPPAAAAPAAPAESAPTPRPRPSPRRRPTAASSPGAPVEAAAAAAPAPASRAAAGPAKPERVDARYATRRAVRFTSSPQQARLYLDGRYIGIADDWDNRGGGRELEFSKPGTHYVRMELPGYRAMILEIDVSPDADKDSPSIDEELDRRERTPYDGLPSPYDRTTGPVEFAVDPANATVTENGRDLGPASGFGAASPLQLSGPAVHDLVIAASGYRPRLVRILVAPNAGKERAVVKLTLKAD